jgi:hypothetical protein
MHLAPGSDLIDAGVNIGLTFTGTAPDLGCFEAGLSEVTENRLSMKVLCYPNPVTARGIFQFSPNVKGRCEIRLFDITGRYIKTLADQFIEAGEQHINYDVSEIAEGLYVYRVILNNDPVVSGKLMKILSGN